MGISAGRARRRTASAPATTVRASAAATRRRSWCRPRPPTAPPASRPQATWRWCSTKWWMPPPAPSRWPATYRAAWRCRIRPRARRSPCPPIPPCTAASTACCRSTRRSSPTQAARIRARMRRSVSTLPKAAVGDDDGYYAHVNASSPGQLRCSLHDTIRGHTVYPYSGSGTSTWTILESADEDPANAGRILDAYRNRSYAKGSDRAGTGSGLTYNREHTWPNSLGFGSRSGDKGLPNAPYTDTHMLYLSDTAYNGDRGNKPYADCPASSNCGARATEANDGRGGGSDAGDSNWVKGPDGNGGPFEPWRSEEHTSELQSLMRISYAVFCLKK